MDGLDMADRGILPVHSPVLHRHVGVGILRAGRRPASWHSRARHHPRRPAVHLAARHRLHHAGLARLLRPAALCSAGYRDPLYDRRLPLGVNAMRSHVLAIDQGTTSSRAIVFDDRLQVVAVAQEEFTQHFPRPGFVEHEPEEIWATVLSTSRNAIAKAGISAAAIAAIGITNQRETTLIWERDSGRPIHRAIVWQDRRTADRCQALRSAGYEPGVTARTGLLLDPYFSGTKAA